MSLEKNEIFDDLQIDLNIEKITLDDIELSDIDDQNIDNSTDFSSEELNEVKLTEYSSGDINIPLASSDDIVFETHSDIETPPVTDFPSSTGPAMPESPAMEMPEMPEPQEELVEVEEPAPPANLGASETLSILQITPEPEIPQDEPLPIPSEDDRIFNQSKALKDAYVFQADNTEIISINGNELDRIIDNSGESQLGSDDSLGGIDIIDEPHTIGDAPTEIEETPVETIPVEQVAPSYDLNDVNDDNFELNVEDQASADQEIVFTSEPTEEIRQDSGDDIPELDLDLSAVTSINDDEDDGPIALSMDELNNIEVSEETEEMEGVSMPETPPMEDTGETPAPIPIVEEELVEVTLEEPFAENAPMIGIAHDFESETIELDAPASFEFHEAETHPIEDMRPQPEAVETQPAEEFQPSLEPVTDLNEGEEGLELMVEEPQEISVNEINAQPAEEEAMSIEAAAQMESVSFDAGAEPELEEVGIEEAMTPIPAVVTEPVMEEPMAEAATAEEPIVFEEPPAEEAPKQAETVHEEPEFQMMEVPILSDEPVMVSDADTSIPEELPASASESPIEPQVKEVQEIHDVIDIVEAEPVAETEEPAVESSSYEEPVFEPLDTPTDEIVFDSSDLNMVMPSSFEIEESPASEPEFTAEEALPEPINMAEPPLEIVEEPPLEIEETPMDIGDTDMEISYEETQSFGSISEVEAAPEPQAAHPHELEKVQQRTLVSTEEAEKRGPSVEMVPLEEEIEMSQNDFEEIAKIEEAEEFEGIKEAEFDAVNIDEPGVPLEPQAEMEMSEEIPEEPVLASDEHVEIALDELNEIQSGIQGEAILSEIPYSMESMPEAEPAADEGIHLSHERKSQIIEEKVVSLSDDTKGEVKKILKYLDTLLEDLPEDKIKQFSQSEYYDLYVKILDKLGV